MRPLRGDHIHQAFAVYVKGQLVDIIWDQEWLGTPDANEGNTYPSSFANLSSGMCAPRRARSPPNTHAPHLARSRRLPPLRRYTRPSHVRPDAAVRCPRFCRYDYHITTTHPHFGMHAGQAYWFGDGLIHSHPGTSWQWFQHTEGLGATLGAFLEQTGVSAAPDTLDASVPTTPTTLLSHPTA